MLDTTERVGRKKVYRKVLIVLGVWLLFIASIIGYGVYWLFFDWSRFKQELIAESTSPDGTYTVNAYVSDGGATTPYTVIYWQYRENAADITWVDDDTVKINGVILDVPNETYDYRDHAENTNKP